MILQNKHQKRLLYCPECGKEASLVRGTDVYPHRKDLSHLDFWVCKTPFCDTRVGCHPGTSIPLGSMATLRLRTVRSTAHRVFDPLWKKGPITRKQAYSWLAKELSVKIQDCHIGQFNEIECNKVMQLCQTLKQLD